MTGCSRECCFGVMYGEWHGVCDFIVVSVVEVCVDYGGVDVSHVCLDFASSMVLGFVSLSVLYVFCFLHLGVVCCDVA